MTHMRRAAVYCRISQDREGTEIGVENQRKASEDLLKRDGLDRPDESAVYVDNNRGASSKSRKKRPDYLRLISDAQAGIVTDIGAYSWSRLTRRPRELEDLIDLAEAGVRFHIVNMGSIDLSTANGRAVARTIAAWDANEAEQTGERVVFAQAGKLQRGEDIGGPRPFGFEPNRTTIRESEAKVLRAAYEMILEGESVYRVAQMFTASGIPRDRKPGDSWRTQTVRHILLRERNVGRLVVKGVQYADDLPAIVDAETFEKVRAVLTHPDRAPKRGPKPTTWAAIGSVRCGVCGSYLSQTGAARNGKRSLRCAPDQRPGSSRNERHPVMDAEALDKALSTLVRVAVTPSTLDSTPSVSTPVTALRLELAEAVRQRDLQQQLVETPGANVAEALRKISKLGERIEAARQALDSALAADVTTAAVAAAMAVVLRRDASAWEYEADQEAGTPEWDEFWSGLSVDERRALIDGLGMRPRLHLATAPRRLTNG
jgi:site-specific DNA recombinase